MVEELPEVGGSPTGEAFELLTAPRGAPDDFSKLTSMSPQIEKKLNEAGIFHFWQLAAMTPADVATVDALGQARRPHRARGLGGPGPRHARERLSKGLSGEATGCALRLSRHNGLT